MSRKPVLVIEDEPDIRLYMGILLKSQGYTVYSASNGREALDILQDLTKPLPGLIALDYYMPVMDARGFLDELPSVQSIRDISQVTIILVTASEPSGRQDLESKIKCSIRKPIDINKFLDLVKQACES